MEACQTFTVCDPSGFVPSRDFTSLRAAAAAFADAVDRIGDVELWTATNEGDEVAVAWTDAGLSVEEGEDIAPEAVREVWAAVRRAMDPEQVSA